MNAAGTPFESQARLWLVAFAASALVNLLVLGVVGFWVIARIAMRPPSRSAELSETVAMIVPKVMAETSLVPLPTDPAEPLTSAEPAASTAPAPPEEVPTSGAKPFVRTSADQTAAAPENPDFMGERNTVATSEGMPQPEAPELPNQTGREPLSDGEIETTQSDYQDGDLVPSGPDQTGEAEMAIPPSPETSAESAGTEAASSGALEHPSPPAAEPSLAKERLAEGPVPVDRRVKAEEMEEVPKPTPPERQAEGKEAVVGKDKVAEQAKPAASSRKPGFQGNQSKTRLEGSITRVGRSALNVEDSVLGRYHATVSRAVEKAWQLHCVRNRDYITPGQLTLRVMLESSGKVRSMGVVEEIGVGNIQKGFTLNSIHDAEIPAMPADLKKQLDGEPLELIYRFNF